MAIESSSAPPGDSKSIDVFFGTITGVAANGTQPCATAALRFRTIDPSKSDFDKERNRGQSANRHERDGGSLPDWTLNLVGDEHANAESDRRSSQSKQIIERDLFGSFWNGYR